MPRNPDMEWETFGRDDPYYGVVSLDKFHKDKLTGDSLIDFFKSGDEHIQFVLDKIRANIDREFNPSRALDFGCGVGRCLVPLAAHCDTVVGVDVSEAMLKEAKKNCMAQSVSNVELLKSDDELLDVSGQFDFIHSFIVFQHIPPARGERIFSRLISLLSENGVAAIQFLYYRKVTKAVKAIGYLRKKVPFLHNVINLMFRKPWAEPLMEKNCYDINKLFLIMHEHGCGNLHATFQGGPDFSSVILFPRKKTDTVPYESFYNAG